MTQIRNIERADLPAIVREPYSVTIEEPGDDLARLQELFEATGYWQEDSGAVAIVDGDSLKGTIHFFRSGPCIHGYELGYVIHDQAEWGKGYATAGLKLLSDKLFTERPHIIRHQLTINCENVGSYKVAEKCGFVREGILRASGFEDPPNDAYVYSRICADLASA